MAEFLISKIEPWVPEAVAEMAARLNADLTQGDKPRDKQEVLERLISHPKMELVWEELFKKRRDQNYGPTGEFLHPARLTNGSSAKRHRRQAEELRKKGGETNEEAARLLEAEAAIEDSLPEIYSSQRWTEQEVGAQIFLKRAYQSAINIDPVFLSDLNKTAAALRKVALNLEQQTVALNSLGMKAPSQALKLVALDIQSQAGQLLPDLKTDDPWVISRDGGDPRIRTYVADLSIIAASIFGDLLP
jgi:hypothetical protein